MRTRPLTIQRYIVAVTISGIAVGAFVVARNVRAELLGARLAVPVLMFLVIVGELYPIRVPLRDDAEDVTTSTAFMFATLLLSGPALAIIAQVSASLLSDARSHKPWWKASFNLAQYALSIAGAALVATTIDPSLHFGELSALDSRHFFAIFAAGVAGFILNNLFVIIAIAIAQQVSVIGQVRNNLGFHTATTMVLIAQGPLIALAALHSIVWVLLFLPGIIAVYRTAGISVAKERLATHDSLTGLPNRLLFRERLTRMLEEDEHSQFVVMIIDLDSFKEVNDTLGHHIGDSLLSQVGERLAERIRDRGTMARLGGDEFAVLAAVDTREEAAALGQETLAALQEPFALQDLPFHIDASLGAALYPQHGTDVDALLQHADVAMYLAKEHGTGYETYAAAHDKYSPRRLSLLSDLRRAIESDELVLFYQPIAELATGSVTRVEALIRWIHPEHGLVMPNDFIPLAEPTGLMVPLTHRVLDLALSQCRAWSDRGFDVRIAVNVSARNLHHSDLPGEVAQLLAKWNLPRASLELEITEGTVMSDPKHAIEILRALNALGVETPLDDFGTGYSSLAHLKRLPVSQLKIDASFVENLVTDHDDAAIVSSTLDLARNLGLSVVAEGVENITTWQRLVDLGCDFAQGYFLSRPLPAEQMTRWLEDRREGRGAIAIPATLEVPAELAPPIPLRAVGSDD